MAFIKDILRHRCPRCREGPVFRRFTLRGWLAMYENCPVCGLKFEREQGYFVGALYISYLLSIVPVLALVLIFWRVAHWSYGTSLAGATIAYVPFVPLVVRLSRVIWMYIDRTLDPN